MSERTATVAEARDNFSRIASFVSDTGSAVTVFRNSKPWVRIAPLAKEGGVDWRDDDGYVDVMDELIRKGLDDYESGRCVSGLDAARREVEDRAAAL